MSTDSWSAVFLDRDGVINNEVHRLEHPDQLVLIDGAADAIMRLNELKIPVFVVTNQAVVARGIISEVDLGTIHTRLADLLAERGARFDAVYYCPHHPEGVVAEYRIVCDCRKPASGMLERAARENGIDLGHSVMIGDRTGDIAAAASAGCSSILVETGYGGKDGEHDVNPTWKAVDIGAAVDIVLREMNSIAPAVPRPDSPDSLS